jgi:hypothetical protein
MENPSLRQLAESLLSQPGSSKAQLLVGQLPEHWPSSVPLIDGAQLVGSVTVADEVQAVLETRLPPEQVLVAYHRALITHGAQVMFSLEDNEPGAAELSQFQLPGQDGNLIIEAFRPEDGNVTHVCLKWLTMARLNYLQRSSSIFREVPHIPTLMPLFDEPPKYLGVSHCTDSDARGRFRSALFRATVTDDVSDVLKHFAQQLESTGWRCVVQADTYSTWQVQNPGGHDAWGVLWVLEWPGRAHQKVVMVRVEP